MQTLRATRSVQLLRRHGRRCLTAWPTPAKPLHSAETWRHTSSASATVGCDASGVLALGPHDNEYAVCLCLCVRHGEPRRHCSRRYWRWYCCVCDCCFCWDWNARRRDLIKQLRRTHEHPQTKRQTSALRGAGSSDFRELAQTLQRPCPLGWETQRANRSMAATVVTVEISIAVAAATCGVVLQLKDTSTSTSYVWSRVLLFLK